ncbi:hypothetical protein ACQEVY_21525 [Streptomyces sp. CA-288835]|uniref:hypothetical protein n=1 Tax=Streptomyces sp. CA-288835 TaxID=3240069 RepID=UPI003D915C4D
MPDTSSPLWWLFAALSAALFLALYFPAMVNGRQKAFMACGPVVGLLVALAYSSVYDWSPAELLPVYCGICLALALGLVGHQKAMRTFMTWRQENPGKPDDEGPDGPWVLQMAFTIPVFLGAAFWYIGNY